MNQLGIYLAIVLIIALTMGGIAGALISNHFTGQDWNNYVIEYKKYVNNTCYCPNTTNTYMPIALGGFG